VKELLYVWYILFVLVAIVGVGLVFATIASLYSLLLKDGGCIAFIVAVVCAFLAVIVLAGVLAVEIAPRINWF